MTGPLNQVVPLRPQQAPPELEPVASLRRERVTIALPAEFMERARNAVWWERGTLAGLVEQAMAAELDRMEQENGGAFQARTSQLRPGRRVKD